MIFLFHFGVLLIFIYFFQIFCFISLSANSLELDLIVVYFLVFIWILPKRVLSDVWLEEIP